MKPIDVIRDKLHYDFQKHTNFTVCKILGVVKLKGVGMVLQAVSIDPSY